MKNNSPIICVDGRKFYKNSIWTTNEGYQIRVVEYNDKYNIEIEFLYNGYHKIVTLAALNSGAIKNPFHPGKYGNYFGDGPYGKHSHITIYTTWTNIFKRLDPEHQETNSRNRKYKNVSICNEWLNYQNFAFWYDSYISSLNIDLIDSYQLDKDILQWEQEYKIYSPNTCCIVPYQINQCIDNLYKERVVENLPMGVTQSGKNTFTINLSINGKIGYFGVFDSPEEAFIVYKKEKEKHIRELADYYYSINAIKENVYNALYNINIKPYLQNK